MPKQSHILVIVLSLLMALLVAGPAAAQRDLPKPEPLGSKALAGTLSGLWGDPAPGVNVPGSFRVILTTDSGERIELLAAARVLSAAGGITALQGERVFVSAAAEQLGVNDQGLPIYAARTISPAGAISPRIAGSQPWVSIMCKFSDVAAEPNDLAFFTNMYASTYPGLNHYWKEQSYDKINIDGSTAHGWYTLPQPRSYYIVNDALQHWSLMNDCTAAADADVYYPDYIGINMMFNEVLDCCAWGGGTTATLDGVTRFWSVTWEPPWGYQDITVMAHEMGHGFGMPHSSGKYGATYDNRWDVMSDTWSDCGRLSDATYGCLGQGTITYQKNLVGWIDADKKYTASPGATATITLERLTQPTTTNYLMAVVPIAGTSRYYTVEARYRVGYDVKLPLASGVIIHEVDTTRANDAQVIDIDLNGNTGDAGAQWLPGETYYGENDIAITVDSATTTGYVVTITTGEAPPEPTDPYEPNDSRAAATPLTYGTVITDALIQAPGDIDFYSFSGRAGERVVVDIDAAVDGSPVDSVVAIQNPSGTQVASNDDYGGSSDSYVEYTLPGNGTYYVTVRHYYSNEGSSAYFYQMSLTGYAPPPTISGFTPTSGGVGTTVTINGTYLDSVSTVTFNGAAAFDFGIVSATQLTATVPSGATTGKIVVTSPDGTGTSSGSFTVVQPPTISSFTPTSGGVGATVTINGTNLSNTTAVKFNGAAATSVTNVSSTQVRAVVPAGATTGPISLTTAGGTATSSGNFTVVPSPTISGFTPSSGAVGTTVTINGTNLSGTTGVKFNTTNATSITNVSATQVTAVVPSGATTGKVSLTTAGGTATSAANFTVIQPPTISSFTPTSGAVGTTVTINGANLSGTTAVTFNTTSAMSITNVSSTQVRAVVPSGATTGKISLTTTGGTVTSVGTFTVVVPAPTISSLSPTSGVVGATVTINGANFVSVTSVKFGTKAATFSVVSATQIQAVVPAGATTAKVSVTAAGGTGTSATNFTVFPAPVIAKFTPTASAVGTTVTITGKNLSGATVRFNGTLAVVLTNTATKITTRVPAGATTGRISVTTTGGTASSATNFTVR